MNEHMPLDRVAVVCRAVAVSDSSKTERERERERESERAVRSLAIVVMGFKRGHRRSPGAAVVPAPAAICSYSSVFRIHQAGRWFLSSPAPSASANQSLAIFPASGISSESRRRTVSDCLLRGQPGGGVGLDVLNSGEPFPPLVGVLHFLFHPFLVGVRGTEYRLEF
ncbi:hypothetical protein Cgig2_023024 [Carnegiea gigantea]|uniref:Uncharacterized protein n=1 Tax=Carnegiea gigantea TaxID=171969 RepID=A0A9Q1K8W2_9CARY|nr:hypothetical protein Cgig2_023024 [Carnegiea gigantea]